MVDEKLVAEIVRRVVSGYTQSAPVGGIPVGVSARHVHLSRADMDILFGKGAELTPLKDLSQPGQYACKETVTIIAGGMRAIENVRVLGPLRSKTQVEVSKTDSFTLKNKPPVRPSGETENSAPITIVGTNGTVSLTEGCIIANRHIHMTPADAARYGFSDGDMTAVEAKTEKRTVLYDVQIRVSNDFMLELHLDTDDANAAALSNGDTVTIVKNTIFN